MYVRPNVYPNGSKIPDSLPPSYQPAAYGNAPAGQRCSTCKNFNPLSYYCSAWKASVKPRWWCEGWEQGPIAIVPTKRPTAATVSGPYKRIATSIVEEHYSQQPRLKTEKAENEEDIISLNVPLMIRIMEYARESASSDIDLHYVAERLVELSEDGDVLDMDSYEDIVNPEIED
jgi:hypothetical protein